MVFLASFVVFLLYVLGLSLSMIVKKRPMMTEDEAKASILDDGACATCTQMCSLAGNTKVVKKSKNCIKDVEIPHQTV